MAGDSKDWCAGAVSGRGQRGTAPRGGGWQGQSVWIPTGQRARAAGERAAGFESACGTDALQHTGGGLHPPFFADQSKQRQARQRNRSRRGAGRGPRRAPPFAPSTPDELPPAVLPVGIRRLPRRSAGCACNCRCRAPRAGELQPAGRPHRVPRGGGSQADRHGLALLLGGGPHGPGSRRRGGCHRPVHCHGQLAT